MCTIIIDSDLAANIVPSKLVEHLNLHPQLLKRCYYSMAQRSRYYTARGQCSGGAVTIIDRDLAANIVSSELVEQFNLHPQLLKSCYYSMAQ